MRRILVTIMMMALCLPLAAQEWTGGDLDTYFVNTYVALQKDPAYQALVENLRRQPRSTDAFDQWIDYLPISPLEMLRADMRLRRYEIAIPAASVELHRLWIERHPDLARQYYGDDVVAAPRVDPPATGEATAGSGPVKAATVGTNYNLASGTGTPPDDYQGEVQVAVDPNNTDHILVGANTMAGCGGGVNTQAAFASTDGGATWAMTCPPDDQDFGFPSCEPLGIPGIVIGSDPALWWDDNGVGYFEYMMVCLDFLGGAFSQDFGIVVAKTTDNGATWSPAGTVIDTWGSGTIQDKEFYNIDRVSQGPYAGRHYTCWDTDNDEQFAWSADSGASWNQVDLPAASTGNADLGCEIAVEAGGAVDVIFDRLTCGGSTCTNEEMYFTRSTDGGATWNTPVRIRDFNLASFSGANTPGPQDQRGINPFGSVDADNSGGSCDGYLYATFTDFTTGTAENTDVFVSRSTDHGATWDAPVRVNDDGEGGPAQFHPFLTVDPSDGSVVVAWHDARNDASNKKVDIYLARSTDCGQTFSADTQVTAPSAEFNNDSISYVDVNSGDNSNANPNQFGEYMGLDVAGGVAYVGWMDSRQYFPSNPGDGEMENVGFAKVTFSATDTPLFADDFETGNTNAWDGVMP